MNSFKRVRASQIELEFGSVGFFGIGENRSTLRKTSRSKEEDQQSEVKCEAIDMKILSYSYANKTHFHGRDLIP